MTQRNSLQTKIDAFSITGGFIKINKRLITKFGIEKAVVIANLVDSLNYFATHKPHDLIDGVWFFQTHQNQMLRTGLGRDRVKKAKDTFKRFGVLETKMMRNPAKEHYKINFDKLEELLEGTYSINNSEEVHPDSSVGQDSRDSVDLLKSVGQDSRDSVGQDSQDSVGHIKTKDNQDQINQDHIINESKIHDISSDELESGDSPPADRRRKKSTKTSTKFNPPVSELNENGSVPPSNESGSMGKKVRNRAERNSSKSSSKKSSVPTDRPIYNKRHLPDSVEELPFYSESNFNIIEYWNSLLKENDIKAKSHPVNRPSLTISRILFYIEMLKQGQFGNQIEIPRNGISEDYYHKEYSDKEIRDVISDFPKLSLEGNWPPDKSWLYKLNLKDFLYTGSGTHNKSPKSHFINLACRGVQKVKQVKEKKKNRKNDYDKGAIIMGEINVEKQSYDKGAVSLEEYQRQMREGGGEEGEVWI